MNTMSVHEAAIVLNRTESTIRRWFHSGKLSGTQDFATNEIRIHRSSVEKLLR